MSYNSVGLIDNPDPPAEPIEREYNDAALLFQNDEQVLERIERLERSSMKEREWALNLLKTTLNQLMMFGTAELERRDAPLIKAAIEAMEGGAKA
jgi:hypothetical protein